MTQKEAADKGIITPQMARAAEREGVAPEVIGQGLAQGTIVLPANPLHRGLDPCAIGKGLKTKVNANLGTSTDFGTVETEIEKLRIAIEHGADTVMDLSTGDNLIEVRQAIMANSPLAVGTVPIYQATVAAIERRGSIVEMTAEDLFQSIVEHAQDGVDFMTVHCGVTMSAVERLRRGRRVTDVVSRGGTFLIGWMLHNNKENPLYEQYDRLLEIARHFDITLSLGDGLRPGSLSDATDRAQVEELIILGELVERARQAGVQAMVEGPGHVPMDQIVANVQLQKSVCKGAPFYVLGPLVTDIGAGYDHITAAIGGAIAAAAGADYICYVTPSEHLALPTAEDVGEGVIAARIAGHAADIVKGVKGAREWDLKMSRARKALDWEEQARLSINSQRSRQVHARLGSAGKACSMCGQYCAMDLMEKYLGITAEKC